MRSMRRGTARKQADFPKHDQRHVIQRPAENGRSVLRNVQVALVSVAVAAPLDQDISK